MAFSLKLFRFNLRSPKSFRCPLICLLILVILIYEPKDHVSKGVSKNHSLLKRQVQKEPLEILNFIKSVNKAEKIRNLATFGAIAADTITLVILLDKNSSGLRFVISSLNEVKGIGKVLVVFSHSHFDERIHRAIKKIDFCRVLQIYYPYSIQTHPKTFPGFDPNDCPYGATNSWMTKKNCTGLLFPDIRGRFRNPPVAEKKHHWWWTANNIFEKLSSTSKRSGLVIFSEHNFVYTSDFIYMASLMRNVAKSLPQCEFLSLGSSTTPSEPKEIEPMDIYGVKVTAWIPKYHSKILAFDLSVWNSIVPHYDMFCTCDDSSWLHSLYYVSASRPEEKRYKTMFAITPRAYKIDRCKSEYTSFFGHRCSMAENVMTVIDMEKLNDEEWFPSYLEVYTNVMIEDDEDVLFEYLESGGWADPRDWGLCRNLTVRKIKKVLMEMKNEFQDYFN